MFVQGSENINEYIDYAQEVKRNNSNGGDYYHYHVRGHWRNPENNLRLETHFNTTVVAVVITVLLQKYMVVRSQI